MNVTANISASISATLTAVASTILAGAPQSVIEKIAAAFINGPSAADSIDLIHAKTYALAAAVQTIDLTSLLDPQGGAVNFKRLRLALFRNRSTTSGQTVAVGNAASNAWVGLVTGTGTFLVFPASAGSDGFALFTMPNTAGAASIDATHKNLKFDPGANTMNFDVLLLGCSA